MPTKMSRLLSQLSRTDLEKLLETKAEVEALETRREELQKELAAIEKKLAKVVDGALGNGRRGKKKATKKKAAKKKVAKKKATKKKATKKKAGKKVAKRAAKKTTRKVAARGRKTAKKGRQTLEDVVVTLLEKKGGSMSFQDILATIVKRKLFTTRSSQFDNVLRRTLSTSKRVKRVSRGVYGI